MIPFMKLVEIQWLTDNIVEYPIVVYFLSEYSANLRSSEFQIFTDFSLDGINV